MRLCHYSTNITDNATCKIWGSEELGKMQHWEHFPSPNCECFLSRARTQWYYVSRVTWGRTCRQLGLSSRPAPPHIPAAGCFPQWAALRSADSWSSTHPHSNAMFCSINSISITLKLRLIGKQSPSRFCLILLLDIRQFPGLRLWGNCWRRTVIPLRRRAAGGGNAGRLTARPPGRKEAKILHAQL